MTTLSAAGTNAESLSCAASAFLRRMCGSIWASAVLLALLETSARKMLRKNNEGLLVRYADPYPNIC